MHTRVITRDFTLSRSEYRRGLRRMLLRRGVTGLLFLWLAVGYLIVGGIGQSSPGQLWTTVAGWMPLLLLAVGWTLWVTVLAPWRLSNSRFSRPAYQSHRYLFDAEGITVETEDGSRATRPYAAVIGVERIGELILLQQDTGQYFVLPRLSFAEPEEMEAVLMRVTAGDGDASREPNVSNVPNGVWVGLGRNLRAGLRLATFRRVRRGEFVATGEQALLLVAITGAIGIAVGRLAIEGQAEFSSYGLLQFGTAYLLLVIGVYLVARTRERISVLILFLVVALSPDPLFEVVATLLDTQAEAENAALMWGFYLAAFVWMMAVWWRAVRVVFATDQVRTAGAVSLMFAVAVLPMFWLPQADYWYSLDTTAEESPEERVNVEELYYAQPRLVETALNAVRQERPGVVDLYHVGFASYAHQAVFSREVNHVRDILDARFDTRDRSLSLINHAKTINEVPIASGTNLELVLRGVAERMNPEEDVLFLYLTSHGSKGAELSVNFRPLGLNQLSAGALRRMLDEAGIRWRVVVISACYSGTFMDALQDKHTLVITAAAKTRTSFGCSNENEYTYFGEAYFKHALSGTFSFVEAYEIARRWVTAREEAERLEPSMPKLHVGEDIKLHLSQLERRLEGEEAHD